MRHFTKANPTMPASILKAAYADTELLFDWHKVTDYKGGVIKGIQAIVRGTDGADQVAATLVGMDIFFATSQIKELVSSYEIEMEKNITERWAMDMKSDSWLSKNIRPLVLIFLVVSTVLLVFIDAGVISFEVKASWVDLLQLVLITVIGAYFGGRSLEKVKK